MNHEPESWFKHNVDSISEPHMRRIRAKFGKLEGYAMYYLTTEIMIKSGGSINIADIDAYADDFNLSVECLLSFFDYCVAIELFTLLDGEYTSIVALHTCERRKALSELRANAGRIGGLSKSKTKELNVIADATAVQPDKQTDPKPKKEAKPDNTQEIVDFWNAKADKGKCIKITTDVKKAISKRAAEYSLDEIKATISNYQAVVQDPKCFFNYVWNISDFFNRSTGFPAFFGGDEILLRYYSADARQETTTEPKQAIEWTWNFPKPAGYDTWKRDDKVAFLHSGGKAFPGGINEA